MCSSMRRRSTSSRRLTTPLRSSALRSRDSRRPNATSCRLNATAFDAARCMDSKSADSLTAATTCVRSAAMPLVTRATSSQRRARRSCVSSARCAVMFSATTSRHSPSPCGFSIARPYRRSVSGLPIAVQPTGVDRLARLLLAPARNGALPRGVSIRTPRLSLAASTSAGDG